MSLASYRLRGCLYAWASRKNHVSPDSIFALWEFGYLSTRIRNYGDVSKDRSLTVAALIGAPTVREGLLQNTRSHLRNGVLSFCYRVFRIGCGAGNPALGSPLGTPFRRLFRSHARVFARGKGRLKAGCSQDWLPHRSEE